MGTITNPLSGLIEGLLQGHELGLQMKRQQMAEQQFKTQQALQERQMSMQDIMNRQALQEHARPISGAGMIESSPFDLPSAPGMPTTQAPGYMRKADTSRTVKYGGQQYELKTPEEQWQAKQDLESRGSAALEQAKYQAAVNQRRNVLQMQGGGIPARGLESMGIPEGTPLTWDENAKFLQEAQKIRAGGQVKLGPGDVLYEPEEDTAAAGAPSAALPGQPAIPMEPINVPGTAAAPGAPGLPLAEHPVVNRMRAIARGGEAPRNPTEASLAQLAAQGDKKAIDALKLMQDKNPTEASLAAAAAGGDKNAAAALALIAKNKIQIAVNTASAKSDAGGLTTDDYARAGEQYARTGVMPSMGRDSATRAKIVHAGNQWARDNSLSTKDLVTMQAAFQGDKESLKKFQTTRDQIVSFEQTAQKNLDLMVQAGQKLVDTGSRWLNQPLRSINRAFLSTDEQAAFDAAQLIARNEVAKVTSGGGLGGVVSDSARHEMEDAMGKDPTIGNMIAVANILKQDMANRHGAMDATLSEIRGRLGGGGAGGQVERPIVQPLEGGGGTTGRHVIKVNGKNYIYKGSGATDDLKNYTPIGQ